MLQQVFSRNPLFLMQRLGFCMRYKFDRQAIVHIERLQLRSLKCEFEWQATCQHAMFIVRKGLIADLAAATSNGCFV